MRTALRQISRQPPRAQESARSAPFQMIIWGVTRAVRALSYVCSRKKSAAGRRSLPSAPRTFSLDRESTGWSSRCRRSRKKLAEEAARTAAVSLKPGHRRVLEMRQAPRSYQRASPAACRSALGLCVGRCCRCRRARRAAGLRHAEPTAPAAASQLCLSRTSAGDERSEVAEPASMRRPLMHGDGQAVGVCAATGCDVPASAEQHPGLSTGRRNRRFRMADLPHRSAKPPRRCAFGSAISRRSR